MFISIGANIVLVLCFLSVSGSILKYERLPNDTRPISYDVHIITGIHNGDEDFSGSVQILIEAINNTERIVIHSNGLTNIKLNLIDVDSKEEFKDLVHELDVETQQMVITSSSNTLNLIAGKKYLLSISYKARFCAQYKGFCLMRYNDSDGNPTVMASSHLSKGFTRTVFPCYDEPALKAKFTISITHGGDFTALSNMPATGNPIDSGEGLVTTKFKETPPMSTYIVAFAISKHAYLSEKVGNTTVRLFYPRNTKGGLLAFDVAKKVLPLMNDYFEIAYPLPKIDHFSTPVLTARAMENWGLIIYHEPVLLADFEGRKYDISANINTVVHEMAHNWFGNLVTPAWWSYYWLSEGIATFYAAKFLDTIKPEWKIMEMTIGTKFGSVIWDYPDQCSLTCHAETRTTGIQSYGKGAFLMRMFENTLTESIFRKGIIKYLKNYQYSSATEDDLFNSLQEAVDESSLPFFRNPGDLNKAMKSWTSQQFYPLVTITRDYEHGTFRITQNLYQNGSLENPELWWIPISFTTSSSTDFEHTTADLILPGKRSMEVDPSDFNRTLHPSDWLVVNKEQYGMYRVNYDDQNWELLTCALLKDPTIFPRYTRAQILRDASAFFKVGLITESRIIKVFSYLEKETDPVPWEEALKFLNNIDFDLVGNESKIIFKKFAANLVRSIFDELGTEPTDNETPLTESMRSQVYSFACFVGLEKCIEIAKNISSTAKLERTGTSVNTLTRAYCYSIKHGDEGHFKELVNRFIEKDKFNFLVNAFPCSENKENLELLINRTINMEGFDSILYNLKAAETGLSVIIEMIQTGKMDEYDDLKEFAKYLLYSATNVEQEEQIIQINKNFGHTFSKETLDEIKATIQKTQTQQDIYSKLFQNFNLDLSFQCLS